MADYMRSEEVAHRIVYTLRTPTNWVEVSKVLSGIHNELTPDAAQWDDTVTVDVGDDCVRFIFAASASVRGQETPE